MARSISPEGTVEDHYLSRPFGTKPHRYADAALKHLSLPISFSSSHQSAFLTHGRTSLDPPQIPVAQVLTPTASFIPAQGNAPYALTCLDEYFLSLQEQFFLRLAPTRGLGQAGRDPAPMLEHLFEGKPRSYGLEYLAKGKSKFPPAARVPRMPASSIPRGKVRAPGPEPCRSTMPRRACRRAKL